MLAFALGSFPERYLFPGRYKYKRRSALPFLGAELYSAPLQSAVFGKSEIGVSYLLLSRKSLVH